MNIQRIISLQTYCYGKYFRKERFDQDYWNSKIWTDNLVMTFRGFNMEASTFVVDTEDDETLKKQFLDWKV